MNAPARMGMSPLRAVDRLKRDPTAPTMPPITVYETTLPALYRRLGTSRAPPRVRAASGSGHDAAEGTAGAWTFPSIPWETAMPPHIAMQCRDVMRPTMKMRP